MVPSHEVKNKIHFFKSKVEKEKTDTIIFFISNMGDGGGGYLRYLARYSIHSNATVLKKLLYNFLYMLDPHP